MGRECCISRGGQDGPSSTVEEYKLKECEEEDTVLIGVGPPEAAGRVAPGMTAA